MRMYSVAIKRSLSVAMLVAAIATTCLCSSAQADEPMSVVQGTVNQALSVLRNTSMPLQARQDQLRQIVSGTFDFRL